MQEATKARGRRSGPWPLLAGALLFGCAFAQELGQSAGQGALQGFSTFVYEKDSQDSWGTAYSVSGRGVGVGTRAVASEGLDCDAVGDEFLELYGVDVLRRIRTFGPTVDGALDANRFASLAKAPFRLSGLRQGGVIGVVQTDGGRLAKFVAQFGQEGEEPSVELHGLTVVDAGTGAVVHAAAEPIRLPSRAAIDLDPPGGEPGYDLRFGPDRAGVATLAAGSGAGLSFPEGSLCRN